MVDQPTPAPSKRRRFWAVVGPLIVVLAGVVLMLLLVNLRQPPVRKPPVDQGMLVNVLSVVKERRQVWVFTHGTVTAERDVVIAPQVAGLVTSMHRQLVVGGYLRRGEPLLTVDEVDYRLAVARSHAAIAAAEQRLAEAESNATVAAAEWKRLAGHTGEEAPSPLTLHLPQLKAARAQLASARAEAKQADVNLQRTTLHAPFNARVSSKAVEVGQYLRVGEPIAVLYGTDRAEVEVPVTQRDLFWIDLPPLTDTATVVKPPPAWVTWRVGPQEVEREGYVARSRGKIDPGGRMSQVIVRIDDPYNLSRSPADHAVPLEIGAFVDIRIGGRFVDDVAVIPAHALQIDGHVLIADSADRLAIRPVTALQRMDDDVLIGEGLIEGDRVILTPVRGPVNGMKLRVNP